MVKCCSRNPTDAVRAPWTWTPSSWTVIDSVESYLKKRFGQSKVSCSLRLSRLQRPVPAPKEFCGSLCCVLRVSWS